MSKELIERLREAALLLTGEGSFISATDLGAAASRIELLEVELERERMRLAACGVVAMSDTQGSAAKARDMREEYRSASCDDVARRVDECISLRAERDALAAELKALREQEPVGYLKKVTLGWLEKHKDTPDSYAGACILCARLDDSTAPLYAHPVPARELTDEDINKIWDAQYEKYGQMSDSEDWNMFARAIEHHLKGEET